MLMDPIKAANHVKYAEKYGVIDGVLDMFFNPVAKPYVTQNGTAVVQVRGVLGVGLTKFEKLTGGVDMNEVGSTIDEMLMNPAVKRIAFDISSPGGTVLGTPELAAKVANLPIPSMAYTNDMMASGGFYVGSQADFVSASPSSYVGSIGVVMVDESYVEYYKQIGLQVEVFRAGHLKAANIAGTGYSEEQRKDEQDRIERMHKQFKDTVRNKRSYVRDEDMEGQIFTGEEAAAKGLITGLAVSFADALADFERTA
jgi:signal peptide peptidase SppA